jgi:DNA mismatch endonuclease, patch repair protein
LVTTLERSRLMRAVKSYGNTSTELQLRAILRAQRVTGWRRHLPLPGKPDFAFPRERLAVFVDGCFWHGCPECYARPKTNIRFWREKYAYNRARDALVSRTLRKAGWTVLRLWEHELRRPSRVAFRIAHKLAR